jgi:hypothetical protein
LTAACLALMALAAAAGAAPLAPLALAISFRVRRRDAASEKACVLSFATWGRRICEKLLSAQD